MAEGSRLSRLRQWLAHHAEAVAFWVLGLVYLVPVWAFPYLPTQDGPAHLNNAQILKEYGNPAAGYQTFFELRPDPLPNLTSHVLLAGLLYVFPPLIAEKVLVSVYILGFAGSFRYFLGAFGPRCRPLSWAGLLLVYQRCFWMGFYNYCLGLILFWLILGYCLHRRGTLHLLHAPVLLLLFTAAYFTHLVGFLLAVVGALGAVLLVPPRRVLAPVLIVVAALPAACLAMDYFERTGFFHASSAMRIVHRPLDRLRGEKLETGLGQELAAIDDELFAHHAGSEVPFSLVILAYLVLLAVFTVLDHRGRPPEESAGPTWLFPSVFGLLLLAVYLLVPNHLGFEHGGYLKTRLALLPPLMALACLRESAVREVRLLVRVVTVLLLIANLVLVTGTIREGNQEVQEFTAGIEAVGSGHRLFVIQPDPRPIPLVGPLLHAADYYCLGTNNVNLDNYEASTPHFPVKYRRGVRRGRNNWAGYSNQADVDIVLCWGTSPGGVPRAFAGWDELFSQGRLRIYGRPHDH